MIVVNAKFYIAGDKKEQFRGEIEALITSSKKEEGCLDYSLYESVSNQNEFVMIENWETQASIEQHNSNPLLKAFAQNLANYSLKQPVLHIMEIKE